MHFEKEMKTKLALITLLALLIRIFFYNQVDLSSGGADALTRAYFTFNLATVKGLILPSDQWPPIHFYLQLPFYLISKNINHVIFLSLLTGIAIIPLSFYLARNFLEEFESFIFCIVMAILPINVTLSVQNLSEAPWCFFVFLTMLFFFNFLKTRKEKNLWFSMGFLAIANGIRLESIFLSLAIIAIVFYREREREKEKERERERELCVN